MSLLPGPDDEVVEFDRGEVRVEVLVRGGKSMTYEQVCDEARSILRFEVMNGWPTRGEVKRDR